MADIPVCPMGARSLRYPKKTLDKSRPLPSPSLFFIFSVPLVFIFGIEKPNSLFFPSPDRTRFSGTLWSDGKKEAGHTTPLPSVLRYKIFL